MPWLGAVTPYDGMGRAMDYVTSEGGERGRDGWVWDPSCSPTLGVALKMHRGRGGLWGNALAHPGGITVTS